MTTFPPNQQLLELVWLLVHPQLSIRIRIVYIKTKNSALKSENAHFTWMLQMLLHVSIVHVIKLSLGTGTFVLLVRYSTTYVRVYVHTAVRTYSTSTCTYCILHTCTCIELLNILFMSVCQMSVQTYIVKLHVVHILEHTWMCAHTCVLHTWTLHYYWTHEIHTSTWITYYMYMYIKVQDVHVCMYVCTCN